MIAARLVAEEGLDYRSARAKAVKRTVGERTIARGSVPDDEELETALLEYLELFDPEHRERLHRRRKVALEWMSELQAFQPYATGAVWRGIAAEHAPVHLQLFHDNPKDVEIDLLNRGVRFEVLTLPSLHDRNAEVEALSFFWRGEPVLLSLHDSRDVRGALKRDARGRADRGDRQALEALVAQAGTPDRARSDPLGEPVDRSIASSSSAGRSDHD